MRVPLSWLAEYVDLELSTDQLAERLTLLGMEVQSVERWGADWQNVVVGEILTVASHPRADRLSLATVTVGSGAGGTSGNASWSTSPALMILCNSASIAGSVSTCR